MFRKSLVFISLLLLLCVSLSVSSAADITIDDMSATDNTHSMSIIQDNPGHKELIFINQEKSFSISQETNLNNSNTKNNNMSTVFYNVSCENDFKNVSKGLKNLTNINTIIVNITSNINTTHEGYCLDFNCKNKTLLIMGNGFNINVCKPCLSCENHFLKCTESSTILMRDIGVSGFNTAILNSGNCIFKNVTFSNNRLEYTQNPNDIGGAIRNSGDLNCYNCSFINNFGIFLENSAETVYNLC